MPIRLKPTSDILARFGLNVGGEGQKYFTKRCADYMDEYVPYDEGNLADYRIEGTNIVYQQQYAKYQYYGMRQDGTHVINEANRNRNKHSNASSYWDYKMKTAHMQDIVDEMQDYIRRH